MIRWVPEQHNWRRMVSKWIVWGRAVSCLHNQAPNLNTIDSLWWNTLTSGTVTLLRYWFCECQSSTTGGRMVSKWIVWGRAVSCLHNQAPNLNTIDSLWWNTLTSGTVTLLLVLILWVPELENWGTDGLQMNCMRRAVSCLHNQAPNLQHNWLLAMEYTDIRYSDITTCIDSVSARAAQLEDGWSPNELYEGEQSHAYIIKHQSQHNWLLVMEYTDIRYSDITTCIDSVSARAAQLEDGWSPNELYEGEQSHAYIIKHPIETQLTSCDGIHSHQVQWHYYMYWFCECQSSTTGGRMVSKWIVWGRAVSCLHN